MMRGPTHPTARERRRGRLVAGLLLLGLGGCASTCGAETTAGAVGELGNGRFLYRCIGASDPACEGSAVELLQADQFPECIAVGGAFGLEYRLLDGSALESATATPVLYVESVNQSFFSGEDDFIAERPGEAAFVVRDGDRVLDVIHLRIVTPDDMEIFVGNDPLPVQEVDVPLGEAVQVRVFPRSFPCPQLGGAVQLTANSSDDAVARVTAGEVLRIQGEALGEAVVRVRIGTLEEAIAVHVVEGPITPGTGTGGTGGTGGTSDAGTTAAPTDTDGPGTTDAGSTGSAGTGASGSTGSAGTTGMATG